MSEAIIVALIAALGSIVGQWLISRNASEKRKIEDAVRDARLDDRLTGVEKRLDEHNNYASRFSEIQTDIAVIKNDVKTLYKQRED